MSYETKVSIRPKFRAKKYRTEVYIFPRGNNQECLWACELKLFVNYVYYKKGLAKQNILINQTIFTPGKITRKFRKDINMVAHRVRR